MTRLASKVGNGSVPTPQAKLLKLGMSKATHLDHPCLAKLRALAAGLPESSEVETWEHPTFSWPWIKCFRSMASGFVPWKGSWFRPYL